MTINVMITDEAQATSAILATGSVVQGDWLFAYQTNTDDRFAAVRPDAYAAGSIAVQRLSTGAAQDGQVVGIALNNASSGDTLDVAHEGLFIGTAAQTVTAGMTVVTNGIEGLQDCQQDASGQGWNIGRALTGASAGGKYVLFRLNV